MKITCFIDNLSAGGAQRQIVILATLLQKAGHEVTILTYYPHDFFLGEVVNSSVGYLCINEPRLLFRVYKIRKALNSLKQDVVIAFLKTPVLLAELSSLPYKKWNLIVSERNAYPEGIDKKLFYIDFVEYYKKGHLTKKQKNSIKFVNKKWRVNKAIFEDTIAGETTLTVIEREINADLNSSFFRKESLLD